MNKEELIEFVKNINGLNIDEDTLKISFTNDINENDIKTIIDTIVKYENDNESIPLNIKNLDNDLLTKIFKISLGNNNIKNTTLILNIINFVKTYNTLSDDFFNDENICVSSVEEFLDLKLSLKEDIQAFINDISFYFICLIKSFGKIRSSLNDDIIEMPGMYDIIFNSMDFQSMCSIFSKCNDLDISKTRFINNCSNYMNVLLLKNQISSFLLNDFYKQLEKQS